jgi:hypothetical protein
MMWNRKFTTISSVFFCLALMFAAFLPSAHAGTWNQMTKLTFNRPVEIPHATLPAGTYWFVLADDPSNRDMVEIYSANWSKRYATLQTVTTQRARPTDDTDLIFAERPANKPEALLKWYYPGELTGHEFVYSSRHEKEFARDAKQDAGVKPLNTNS